MINVPARARSRRDSVPYTVLRWPEESSIAPVCARVKQLKQFMDDLTSERVARENAVLVRKERKKIIVRRRASSEGVLGVRVYLE